MSESDEIHRELQEHFDKCSQCQQEISEQKKSPKPFGRRAKFCEIYYLIVQNYRPPEKSLHDA